MGRCDPVATAAEKPKEEKGGVSGITLDAGGLIALDRNDRRIVVLLTGAIERGLRVTVPATGARAGNSKSGGTGTDLTALDATALDATALDATALDATALDVIALDATVAGLLLASSGTSDIVDAHVVVCARRTRQTVVTSDPDELRRIPSGTGIPPS
jgi:hypothetical protein